MKAEKHDKVLQDIDECLEKYGQEKKSVHEEVLLRPARENDSDGGASLPGGADND